MNNLHTKTSERVIVVEDGLLRKHPTFNHVLRAAVYSSGSVLADIAHALNVTPNKLSRLLAENENDTVRFPASLIAPLIQATGDTRPIQWLACAFLESPEEKRNKAMDRLAELIPEIQSTLEEYRGAENG